MTATVLLVEDHDWDDILLPDMLSAYGYDVAAADGAEDLAEAAAACRPAAVLVDPAHARVPGAAVLRALRADPRTRAVPVLAVTAERDPAALARLAEAGYDRVFGRPLVLADLLAAVAVPRPADSLAAHNAALW